MRVMIAVMLAAAVLAVALVASPDLRSRAEAVLFGDASTTETSDTEPAEEMPVDVAAERTQGALQKMWDVAAKRITEGPQGSDADTRAAPAAAAGTAATEDPGEAAQPFTMPASLSRAWFGMSPDQVNTAYKHSWKREQSGELMLAHYPLPDESQVYRFHFSGDSLYLIEVQLKRPEGHTLKQLYDHYRQSLARQYQHLPETSSARWSDGTVHIHIGMDRAKDLVIVSYRCPSAKR